MLRKDCKKRVKAGSCLHSYLFLRLLARKCDRRHILFMRRVSGLSLVDVVGLDLTVLIDTRQVVE